MKCRKSFAKLLSITIFLCLAAAHGIMAQEANAPTDLIQIMYNDQNGLPTNEANTVLQTRDGYIWIGGYGGLVRYDGQEFCNYSVIEGGLTTSGIRALFEDSRGRMWVGTNDKGVFLYENGIFTPCEAPKEDLYRSIRCFAEDTSGVVFAGTSTGLAKISHGTQLIPAGDEQLKGETIYSLSFDQNGILWGTAGAGFAFALKDERLVYWLQPGELNEGENYTLLAHEDTIYIGTNGNALLRLTLTDKKYEQTSFHTDTFHTGSLHTIMALCLTRDGRLWVGGNTGSGWFDEAMVFHILDDLEHNTFLSCIIQDYEDNLWMASTQSGVFLLTKGRFLNASKAAGVEGKSVNAMVKLDGLLYIASDYGLYITDQNWNMVTNDLTRRLDGKRIRHLYADSLGNLWISTYSDLGLLCYTPSAQNILSITEADGLLSSKARCVIELNNGDIAVATTAGVNVLRNNRVTESYGQEQGLENPMILCLLQTSDNTLLAGSDGMGIYSIKDGIVANLGQEQGLDAGVVLRMREDEIADGVWISAGSGLYFMESSGHIREITEFRYGIGSVYDIQVMEHDIWLMKSNGIIIVPRSSLLGTEKVALVQYGRENGLTANLTANSWNLFQDKTMYLCSVNGIYLLNETQLSPKTVPPKTVINEIAVQLEDGQTTVYQNPQTLSLPSNTRRITIRFACPSFSGAPGTLEYCLENFDNHPISVLADQAEAVSYTNLSGGDYVFHLSARNADGIQGANALSVLIYKEPRFFERPAVWVLAALITVLILALLAKLGLAFKTRQLKRRQQEYKAITDQALKTIANTIDAKDAYTKGHSVRVAEYSLELARRLGLTEEQQEKIYYTALLHDIGKIGIPDAILNKPGKLTDEEFEVMRSHTLIGGDILKDFTALPEIGQGALSHHEDYDGGGYPNHQQGDHIPLVARIIRAADAYDAMATKRAYRDGMSREYILSELQKFSGIQFDPRIAQLMVQMIQDGFTVD